MDFVQHVKGIRLQQDECIMSYNVKAFFTSVPIVPAINIITDKLIKDKDLQQRTSVSVNHIFSLMEFCLKNTYFVFLGRYYEQMEGAAMWSPIPPSVTILYSEAFEVKPLNTSPYPPSLWKRYVDDTFVVIKSAYKTCVPRSHQLHR